MSYEKHKILSKETPVRCAVVTVSDTRSKETDTSGALIMKRIKTAGHKLVDYQIVRDEPDSIVGTLDRLAQQAEVIIFNGGTGISKRDNTVEALAGRFDKTIPGFGELFRMLSFKEIGPGAMLSRAVAGTYRDSIVFCTPGSSGAVRLAVDELIVPEMAHLVWEIIRQRKSSERTSPRS